jgi:thioredoxin 1
MIMKYTLYALLMAGSIAQSTCTVAQTTKPVIELDVKAFSTAMGRDQVQLVDVRTPAEYAAGHLIGSVNIDWTAEDYEAAFAKLDKSKPVLLYCHSGGRSEQALEHLLEQGYKAQHLVGGYAAWKQAGLATVK